MFIQPQAHSRTPGWPSRGIYRESLLVQAHRQCSSMHMPQSRQFYAPNMIYHSLTSLNRNRPINIRLGGWIMVEQLTERLVLDVVMSVIGEEAGHLTLESDFTELGVDQLTITHIVLALEHRLGVELPTHVEDAQTISELTAGVRDALRANATAQCRLIQREELSPIPVGRAAQGHLSYRALSLSSPPRRRRRRVHRVSRFN
jgi:acyl carrier protein